MYAQANVDPITNQLNAISKETEEQTNINAQLKKDLETLDKNAAKLLEERNTLLKILAVKRAQINMLNVNIEAYRNYIAKYLDNNECTQVNNQNIGTENYMKLKRCQENIRMLNKCLKDYGMKDIKFFEVSDKFLEYFEDKAAIDENIPKA